MAKFFRNRMTIGSIPQFPSGPDLFPSTSLVAYYKLDGNSNDSKGTKHGTDNTVSYSLSNGKINQGAGFLTAGVSSITLPVLSTVTDNVSLACWVKFSSLSTSGIIFMNGNGGTSGYGLMIGNGSGGNGDKLCGLCGGVAFLNSGTSFAATNTWYFIGLVRESGTWRFYLDGYRTGSTATNNPNTPSTEATFNGDRKNTFVIDEGGFWERALSDADFIKLYNNGNGLTY
jgi:hypothetical protein